MYGTEVVERLINRFMSMRGQLRSCTEPMDGALESECHILCANLES